jgi:hypothetical protein
MRHFTRGAARAIVKYRIARSRVEQRFHLDITDFLVNSRPPGPRLSGARQPGRAGRKQAAP